MTHWRKKVCKDSKHLNHWDIEDCSPVEVTIAEVTTDKVVNDQNQKEDMMFLRIKGAKKMLGVNVTNGALIEAATGTPHVEEWAGKKITLRTAVCRDEECIRVHADKGTKLPKRCPKFKYTDNISHVKRSSSGGAPPDVNKWVDEDPPDDDVPADDPQDSFFG